MDVSKLLTQKPAPLTQEQREKVAGMFTNPHVLSAVALAAQQVVDRATEQAALADILDPTVASRVLRMQGKRVGVLEFFEALSEYLEKEEDNVTAE